ncbi:MAG: class I SAM-dependent methyltransferase [Candidatus Odinarchaeota archaeon]
MVNSSFNNIAQDYHLKRKKPWRPLIFFLDHLKKKGYIFRGISLDLGCGNGRNFKLMNIPPNKLIGLDISLEIIKIAKINLKDINQFSQYESNFIQLILGDIASPPFRENSLHNIYSIASFHHLKKFNTRKNTILQIFTQLKNKGYLILTVWRKWQIRFRNYFFYDWFKRKLSVNYKKNQRNIGLEEFGDKYIPWTLSKEQQTFKRFYHFFSKHEIRKLLKKLDIIEFKITGGPTEKDNFFVLARKSTHS